MTIDVSNDTRPAERAVHERSSVSVVGVRKSFGRGRENEVALDDVSMSVGVGEFAVLLGPSGCGKTTLLRCIAGLEQPEKGSITVSGVRCFDAAEGVRVRTESRGLSMVFQSYALWPHMTVFQNVAYPLGRRGRRPKQEIADAVNAELSRVGIPGLGSRYPSELSGGQQQRAALARALISQRDLILFDEPLSNVDAKVREKLRYELLEMQNRLGFAAVYVTHDQDEAMYLADRIFVMERGRVAQVGQPRTIYDEPSSLYVADFVGKVNRLEGRVTSVQDGVAGVETALGTYRGRVSAEQLAVGDPAVVAWRPEHTRRAGDGDGNNVFGGVSRALSFQGHYVEYHVVGSDRDWCVWVPPSEAPAEGTQVALVAEPRHCRVFRAP